MAAGTCSQPSLSPTQTMRNKAKSMLSLTAPSQMKRRASANLSHRTSYSSSNTSIGSAPPTPTSPTHPTGSGSTGSLSDSNGSIKPKKIRPGGGRRSYVGPSRSQVSLRPIPSMTTLPVSKPAPVQPAKQNVPKLKIKTGGGRRHMTVAKPPPAPPTLFPINVEAEVLDVRVMSPSPPASLPSRPSSPVPSSSSSSQQAPHAIPTPSTPSTRRIRIPPAPRIPPPPVPGSDPTLSPLSLSPLHSPARILHALPPSPSLSPSSPRRPFRALPSPPSPRGMPIPLSSSAPLPSAIRRLPSPPSSSLFSPLTPPSPLLLPLPLPQSFSPHQHELELLQSSSRSVYRNRRYSDVSEVETLPPYTVDPVSPPLSHSGSEHSSPSGYGSPQLVPIGHPIMRHGRNRHRRGSRNARSPNILPTQIEEQEDGLDQNGPLLHMKSSSVASDLLFYQENVMVPLFSGSPSSRPVHSRRRSSSTPPSSGASGSNTAPHHQTSLGDETLFLRRHIKPLDTKKANKEYKLPSNKPTEDDEDSDVDPAVCESPGYQGDSDRFERQMARYQDRKARYEESLQY